MNKSLAAVLVIIATSVSWAFYPKEAAPTQYLMVIRDIERTGYTNQPRPALTVIEPDGTFKTEELPVITTSFPRENIKATIVKGTATDSTSTRLRRFRYASNYVYQAEIRKLNELSAQGWVLINTIQEGGTTRYLLRKD
jgi:hypothetical protein